MPKNTNNTPSERKHTCHEKAPAISIFIHNEVKQAGQRQEQKQRHEDDSEQTQNSGCMAWIKKLCK